MDYADFILCCSIFGVPLNGSGGGGGGGGNTKSLTALTAATGILDATYNNGTAGVGATLTDASGTFAPFANDGLTYSVGTSQTIWVNDQANPAENGLYYLSTNGDGVSVPWVITRSTTFDTVAQMIAGLLIVISSGNSLASSIYVLLNPAPTVIGTDDITSTSMLELIVANQPAHTLFGNPTGVSGEAQPITLGTNLSFSGSTLNAAGGSGSPAGSNKYIQYNAAGSFGANTNFQYDPVNNNFTMGAAPSIHSGVTQSVGFGSSPYLGGSSSFIFGAAGAGNGSTGVVMFGYSNNISSGNYSFTSGFAAFSNQAYNVAIGAYATPSNAGSHVYSDQNASAASDTAVDQWCGSFAGGYNFNLSSSVLAASIDTHGNLVNHKGIADQSYSYQAPTTGFTISPASGVRTLELDPAGTLATGLINLSPIITGIVDGEEFRLSTTQTITALSWTPGGNIKNAPTTLPAGQGAAFIWNAAHSAFYPLYQPSAGGGGGGVTASQIQTAAFTQGIDTGIVDAYVVALSPAISSYTDGQVLSFTPANSSTASTPTVDFGGGAASIYITGGNHGLLPGDINAGIPAYVQWTTASGLFNLLNPCVSFISPVSKAAGNGSGVGGDGSSVATGNYSLAYGDTTNTASGLSSFALGSANTAGAQNSFALGQSNTINSSGNYSFALGNSNTINGLNSFAMGVSNSAGQDFSFALGSNSVISNVGSVVWTDPSGTGNTDTLGSQFILNYSGGFNYNNGTTPVFSADATTGLNFITNKGTANQSYSYQVPTTGFTITPAAGVSILTLAPAGTLASGTIALGSLAPIDGQIFRINATQTITSLSFSGATVNNAPSGLGAGMGLELQYNLANTAWNPLNQPSIVGGALVSSGTYTPTLAGIINVSTVTTAGAWQYIRVGNVVTVSGTVDINSTTTLTGTAVSASLPITNNNFTAYYQAAGAATTGDSQQDSFIITASIAGNKLVNISGTPIATSNTYIFSFTYSII